MTHIHPPGYDPGYDDPDDAAEHAIEAEESRERFLEAKGEEQPE